MDRLRITSFAAVFIVLFGAHSLAAQTAANIAVLAGNGQIVCLTCLPLTVFQPLVVKVTDASGQPIINQTVNWTALQSTHPGALPFFFDTTPTDGNGIATNNLSATYQIGSVGNPILQYKIQASIGGVSTVFTETQALTTVDDRQTPLVGAVLVAPDIGSVLSGTAGGTSSTQVKVHVDARSVTVSGASVRLILDPPPADPTKSPSATCATGAGADPGSVLTDDNGDAVCNVIFGPVSGTVSNVYVLVGGVDPATAPGYTSLTTPVGFIERGAFGIKVTPGVPGLVTVSSGANQNINPGQQTSPLVVKVTDATGQNPISGASVVWSSVPAGAVTFNPASSTSDSQGLASTVATLSSGAVGAISIRAALTGAQSNIGTTLTVTANVTLTGLQKVSGEPQTAAAGQAFAQPLVVQVNGSAGQPLANYPVSFTISGPGTLSSQTASTNSAGRAQVTVTAGATQGNVTVTASAGSFSQNFALTVIPPGPSLTVSGFLNGADFQLGALSPCSIATIVAPGIASNVQGIVVPGNIVGPLPYNLANVKVSFGNSQAPIYNVANVNGQQQVTVQVPCDVTPGNVAVTVNVAGGSGTITVPILPASPGAFQTVSSDGVRRVVAARPDGSFVSIENPARRGEIIRAYATGLGPVAPPIATNSIPVPGTDSMVLGQVIIGVNNAGTRLVSAALAQNLIGVYEVAFQVPNDAPAGNDIVFSVGINAVGDTQTRYSAGTKIPIL